MTGRDLTPFQVQAGFDVRLEWGPQGLRTLAPVVDTIVIVDVLSFTTSVTVAVDAGAHVLPYRWKDGGEAAFAEEHGALLAGEPRRLDRISLSPSSLRTVEAGTRVVLPSANGSALSFAAVEHGAQRVIAACLRNASAVAAHLDSIEGTVGIIPAGERWRGGTGAMRVALEDLLGAGAVIAALAASRSRSAEAGTAAATFRHTRPQLGQLIATTASGRQLEADGFEADIVLACEVDASHVVPVLTEGAFVTAA